ncbi:DUF1801 domain-containing protein [Leeuwenhoekiella polynyae]|uniref:YdhG-like domain-containing protein n=1 Tax=Leeuwenhoekiella polynyae TaxID=1550906 RepID=A0A4Q0PBC0_9FLAO|nr:DUF1801 domain-containing protein [Leeuwenhoekiella polynyae]RXG24017.1 putative protein DUF1801 [Leeuwenhoekiella polynyae]
MAENKNQPTSVSVLDYINAVEHQKRKSDALKLYAIFNSIMPEPAVLWGDSLIGYGSYHYKYDSGREGDFFLTGFAPRKQNLSVYIIPGFEQLSDLLNKLGKYKTGVSCLYINKLEDINLNILEKLIIESVNYMRENYENKV